MKALWSIALLGEVLLLTVGLVACSGITPAPVSPIVDKTPTVVPGPNIIQLENQKTGDSGWVINRSGVQGHYVEGYASAPSVPRGGKLTLFISSKAAEVDVVIYRMGWYDKAGGRIMLPSFRVSTFEQAIPTPAPVTGLLEANWKATYELAIPMSSTDPTVWCSGVYMAKLTAVGPKYNGYEAYIPFVVRDDNRASDILLQRPMFTDQAHSNWGGKSLHFDTSTGGIEARKVSLERPFYGTTGAGTFFPAEYQLVRFLEREGYDVTYSTSLDTHEDPKQLLRHKVFLIAGHDEYVTYQMRAAVETARAAGVSLIFMGADAFNEQARLEPSISTGTPNRTLVSYKDHWKTEDPYALDSDPSNDIYIATDYKTLGRPSDALVGTSFFSALPYYPDTDLYLSDTSSFLFANTGLHNGDVVTGILGDEVDRYVPQWAPPNVHEIARSPVHLTDGRTLYSSMVWYQPTPRSIVFSAGTSQFSWALDDYNWWKKPSRVNPGIQQMYRNLLNYAIGR